MNKVLLSLTGAFTALVLSNCASPEKTPAEAEALNRQIAEKMGLTYEQHERLWEAVRNGKGKPPESLTTQTFKSGADFNSDGVTTPEEAATKLEWFINELENEKKSVVPFGVTISL